MGHDRSREYGPALEAAYRFTLWLVPTVEKFPRSQKFLLGDRIQAISTPTGFLGYELFPGYRRLPEDSVRRFRTRYRSLRDRVAAGTIDPDEAARHIDAWIGHAANAHTWRLRQSIFRDGPFDPKRKPVRPLVASVSCATGPGTTNRGTCAPRTETGTRQTTGTPTTVSASPAHPRAGAAASKDTAGVQRAVQGRPW